MSISVFGKYISALRESRSLTIEEFSGLTGITVDRHRDIESGKVIPAPTIINKLSKVLKTPHDELMIAAGYYTKEWVGNDFNRRIAYEFTLLKMENTYLRDKVFHLEKAVVHLTDGLSREGEEVNV
ncbi:helix-turn-helix domain-containing protein [Paenibacillus azoreducens]|uniref:helix-turn-helix domain-containing protein n=1 Tax=Paenibacillus azoreducens TaxID=116718 RepID=UPI0039F4E4D8